MRQKMFQATKCEGMFIGYYAGNSSAALGYLNLAHCRGRLVFRTFDLWPALETETPAFGLFYLIIVFWYARGSGHVIGQHGVWQLVPLSPWVPLTQMCVLKETGFH